MDVNIFLDLFELHLGNQDGWCDHHLDGQLTEKIREVLDNVAHDSHLNASRHGPEIWDHENKEYLNIDHMFFDRRLQGKSVLPTVCIEHENSFKQEKIELCLWKVLCVRTSLQVLICYQYDEEQCAALAAHLEGVVRENKLMVGNPSKLLVLMGERRYKVWDGVYRLYEWRRNALQLSDRRIRV